MKKILIIDDDIHIGNMLEEVLTKENYHVSRAYSGTEALMFLQNNAPDLILLDLMLPGLNGEQVLPKIKNIPVIIMSAKIDMENKINLLLNGAMDYITKPFDVKELLARIVVQLRKSSDVNSSFFSYKNLKLDLNSHQVFIGETYIKLTRTEFAILKLLIQNETNVVTKSTILENISLDTPDCTESSLKIHVSNLRKKLREIDNETDYIESVWGIGFKML